MQEIFHRGFQNVFLWEGVNTRVSAMDALKNCNVSELVLPKLFAKFSVTSQQILQLKLSSMQKNSKNTLCDSDYVAGEEKVSYGINLKRASFYYRAQHRLDKKAIGIDIKRLGRASIGSKHFCQKSLSWEYLYRRRSFVGYSYCQKWKWYHWHYFEDRTAVCSRYWHRLLDIVLQKYWHFESSWTDNCRIAKTEAAVTWKWSYYLFSLTLFTMCDVRLVVWYFDKTRLVKTIL